MKEPHNSIISNQQSHGVKGWVYNGVDGKQMACWICAKEGISPENAHEFDWVP
jgi:hypothetical protein